MPVAIPAFFAAIGNAITGYLISVGISYTTAVFIVSVGAKLIGLALLGAIANKLIDIPDLDDTAKSNLITVRGTLEHQRILYGETLLTGPLWYLNTAGTHNQSLYHAIVLAGHQIEDITDVWLDDEIIPEAAIDWAGDGSVDSGWLAGDTSLQTTAYFDKFLGTPNQAASPDLVGAFSEINSQHQGRGIAWFLVRLDFFDGQTDVWSGGAPRNYKALAKGKLVYNPNSDSTTAWGTGPHRVNSAPTWEYSNNPALCWADYMIDANLGFGEDPARIEYGYVASVAAICSASVATPNSDTTERFKCNGALSTAHAHRQNLESILSSGNMTMALVQGVWKLRGWEYETPALAFGDDDLRGDIQIELSTDAEKRFNTVRPYFIDRDRRYQAMQAPSVTASEYVARDNGEVLHKDIQLPMTTDIYMAQRLAAGLLEQSDLQRTVIYPSNFKTLPVEIGGTIMLSNTKMGWDQDTFRVTNYKINDMKGIDLVLQEDNAGAYTDVATDEYTVSSEGVYTKNNPGVPAPTNFDAKSVVDGVLINWDPPAARLYERVQIYRSITNSFGVATKIKETRNTNYIDVPNAQGQFYYWGRSINYASEVSSPTPDVNSGDIVRWAEDTFSMLADPTFEKTPLGVGQSNNFWTKVDSFAFGPVDYKGYASINSDSGGIKTAYLHHVFVINSEQQANNQAAIFNTKFVPVIEAARYHLSVVYRVPVFTSIKSGYLEVEFQGRFAHTLQGASWAQLNLERIVTPINSVGWTTFSAEVLYSDLSFSTNSATMIGLGLNYQARADTTTGTLHIDIDKVILKEIL